MAIVYHQATLTPGKLDLISHWLDLQSWGGAGEVRLLGAYRFDDPAGEVGIEGHLLHRGDQVLHVPVSYRGAPLDDPAAGLIGRSQHSLLGERYVYDATTDPVAIGCFVRAVRGEQDQAVYELYEDDTRVGHREPTAVLSTESGGDAAASDAAPAAVIDLGDGRELRIARVLGTGGPGGNERLRVTWDGGVATLATLTTGVGVAAG